MEAVQSVNALNYQNAYKLVPQVQTDNTSVFAAQNNAGQMSCNFKGEPVISAPQLERSPKVDTVNFTSNNNPQVIVKEPSSGKKWGVGIASAIIPGLGQAINNQWGKGVGFFLGSAALGGMAAAMPFFAIPAVALGIWSIVDAVKNVKPSYEVV